MSKSSIKIFLGITFISFLLYLPVFLVPFAFHNDGAYVSCKGSDLLNNFNETSTAFEADRPVLAIYCGVQSWLIHQFSDLSICRVISFLFLAIFNFIFYRYLIKNCRLSTFWASAIVAICFFISPNLLSVIWCNHQGPGVFNMVLASLSYLVFNESFPKVFSSKSGFKRWEGMAGVLAASVLFLTALFCYPPTALIILIFSFARLLFPQPDEGKSLRNLVFRDILFVVILMGIFRLFSTKFVMPWVLQQYHFGTSSNTLYSLELTNNFFQKAGLLASILGYSLRGIWDFWGQWLGGGIVLVFMAIAWYLRRPAGFKDGFHFPSDIIERFSWGWGLFILANFPSLLAKGCNDISDYGYRILVPSMMMGALVIFKVFILAEKSPFLAVKKLAIFFIVSSVLVACWLEIDTVRNSHQEYKLAMSQLRQTDFSKIDKLLFVVNNRGETLIGRKLPLEFSLLSVLREHVNAYVIEYFHNINYSIDPPQIINRGLRIFVGPATKVIDLSFEALNKTKNPRYDDVVIRPQSFLDKNISVKVLESLDGRDVVMGFQTTSAQKGDLPLWLIEGQEKMASLEIIAKNPLPITGYNCFVSTENEKEQGLVKWILQGSNDGLVWKNLDIQANILPLGKAISQTYPIKDQTYFSRYRFIWNKEEYPQKIGIELIKLRFLN